MNNQRLYNIARAYLTEGNREPDETQVQQLIQALKINHEYETQHKNSHPIDELQYILGVKDYLTGDKTLEHLKKSVDELKAAYASSRKASDSNLAVIVKKLRISGAKERLRGAIVAAYVTGLAGQEIADQSDLDIEYVTEYLVGAESISAG